MPLSERLVRKIDDLRVRHEELTLLLAEAEVVADREKFPALSREYAELGPVVNAYEDYLSTQQELDDSSVLLEDDDPDIRDLALQTIDELRKNLDQQAIALEQLLVPEDPNDRRNVFLEIRAGTGGDEAAIFSGDLAEMYGRYAATRGWNVETVTLRPGEHGGYKIAIFRIEGSEVYARLKFESGGHRVQRVPKTESSGRIHTSACTVAILPEAETIEEVDINPNDLRVDTFRASGAGGQHVNKTDSAVRLTHLPTKTVVECQAERSQHRNRERAMSLLQAKLLSEAVSQQEQEQAAKRKSLVGSGDRSQRVRTYNYLQGRITDHRINLTLYKLEDVLAGDLDQVIDPLITEQKADDLRSFHESSLMELQTGRSSTSTD